MKQSVALFCFVVFNSSATPRARNETFRNMQTQNGPLLCVRQTTPSVVFFGSNSETIGKYVTSSCLHVDFFFNVDRKN